MDRRFDIDILRIVSSFGIIWFHSGIFGHEISSSALICYLILSGYLSHFDKKRSFSESFVYRFNRLMVPWLFWFFVYGILNIIRGKTFLPEQFGFFVGILHGTSIHLWYVPFIFTLLLFFDFIKKFFSKKQLSVLSSLFAIAVLLATPLWRSFSFELGYPFAQYFHAIPAFFVGIFFQLQESIHCKVILSIFIALIFVSLSVSDFSGVGLPYLIGIFSCSVLIGKEHLMFLKCVILKSNILSRSISVFSKASFGVYLVHVALLSVAKNIFNIQGIFLPFFVFVAAYFIIIVLFKVNAKFFKVLA